MRRYLPRSRTVLAVLLLAGAASPERAGFFQFRMAAPQSTSDGPVFAEADITTSLNQIIVVLKNFVTGEKSIGQAVSGITFNVQPNVAGVTLASVSGTGVIINGGGSYTPASYPSANADWTVAHSTDPLVVDVFAGGQPDWLIAGAINTPADPYPGANGSMVQHSPVFEGSATIVLNAAGVTSASTINGPVTISFGTSLNEHSATVPPGDPLVAPVPAPPSVVLLGVGAGLSLLGRTRAWRRRPSRPTVSGA
jgi:hypothetical protein